MAAPPAGWRPMRAIVDDDEALMYLRRGTPGDEKRARRLLARHCSSFAPSTWRNGSSAPSKHRSKRISPRRWPP